MKLILITCMLLSCFMATGQVQEPKFAGDVAILNEDGTLTLIQNDEAKLGAAFNVSVDGTTASISIPAKPNIQVIVKADDMNTSPKTLITAFKLKVKKGKRTALMNGYVKSKDIIKYTYDTYGESSYILTFTDLEPGEYGVWYGDVMEKNMLGEHEMAFFSVE